MSERRSGESERARARRSSERRSSESERRSSEREGVRERVHILGRIKKNVHALLIAYMYICKKDGKDSKEKSKEEKKDSGEGRQRREARRDACHRATTPSSAKESTMRRRRWQEWATSRRLLLPDPVTHVRRAKGVRAAEERLGTRSRTRTGHLLLTAYQPADSHRPSLRVSPAGCVRARPCEETRGYYGTQLSTCINAARALATRQTSRTLPRPTRAPRPNGRCH